MSKHPKIQWNLKEISISSLKEHPKNPRQIGKEPFKRLSNLIEKFGLIDKPIVNQDMMIIGGHQRIKCLKKNKIKEVECWIPDRLLLDEQVEELMIGVNKIHGQFDYDILANEFDPINLLKWGFSEKELLDSCQVAEEILESQNESVGKHKKNKTCPSCGHEF